MPLEHSTSTVACGYGPGSNASSVEAVDADRPRLALDLLPGARELVQAAAADLQRRHHRRHLLDVADEARASRSRTAASVTGIGRRSRTAPAASSVSVATPNAIVPRYAFVVSCRKRSSRVTRPSPTSSTPVASGIERAGVADPLLPEDLAQLRHDVVRREAGRLVDDHQPVVHQRAGLARSQSAARMRSTVVGDPDVRGEAGGEAVAAAAVRRGDVADVGGADRAQAHLHRAVGLLLEHARDVGLGGAAHDVDEALDLVDRDVVARQHVLGHRGPHERLLPDQLGRTRAPRRAAAGTRSGAPRRACGSAC